MTPRPFTVRVPDEVLADLRTRLERVRWPDEIAGEAWRYGTSLAYMKELVAYWLDRYDWRAQEARLNELPQFTVPMGDLDLHFIHAKGVGPSPLPLLVSHGWPGSVWEFHTLIPLLTDPGRHGGDPADAFTVVAPSLPGYGYSFRPTQPRFGVPEIADLLAGIHVTLLGLRRDLPPPAHPTEEERAYLEELRHWEREETGYGWIQGTRPQTLAYGLTDSPVGLAAWIVEKFRAWSDCGGDVERRFTKDVLLTNVMLYWVTGAINSSFWPYYARRHVGWPIPDGARIEVPTAYASFPREILHPPRAWAERVYNIRRWTVMPAGGHFAALEEPEALAADLRAFFRDLR